MGSLATTGQGGAVALSRAEGELQRLTAKLQPSTDDEALSVIRFMFKVLPLTAMEDEDGPAILLQAYLIACRNQPKWALVQARDAFIRGEVAGHSSPFCPNPAVFGREVTRIADKERLAATRARQQAEQERKLREESETDGPLSAEARATVTATLARMRAVSSGISSDLRRQPEPKAAVPGYAARVAAETAATRSQREEQPS